METTTNKATINKTTNIQEDSIMTKRGLALIIDGVATETTLDALDLDTIINLKDLTKDILRIMLKEEGVEFSNTEFKSTKRADLINRLYAIMHPATPAQPVKEEKKVEPTIASPVPVGDMTYDNPPVVQPVVNTSAKERTDKLFALLKKCAADNKEKGFGYTISSYMLQACILNAGAGIPKMKGHVVTDEENKMTQEVYSWLKRKGFIQPCVYSVQEDEKIRIYTENYPGKTDTKHVTMVPYAKSKGYTAKKVTSFLVTIK